METTVTQEGSETTITFADERGVFMTLTLSHEETENLIAELGEV